MFKFLSRFEKFESFARIATGAPNTMFASSSLYDPSNNMMNIESHFIPDLEPDHKHYKHGAVILNEPDYSWLTCSTQRYKYWNVTIDLASGHRETLWNVNIEMIGMCKRYVDGVIEYGIGIPPGYIIRTKNGHEARKLLKIIHKLIDKIYDEPYFLREYVMDW